MAGLAMQAVRVVARRPHLWTTAVRQAGRMAPRGWWRRPPFVPRPDPAYLSFRMETQYGSGAATPSAADLVSYLEWCRAQRREPPRRRPPRQ